MKIIMILLFCASILGAQNTPNLHLKIDQSAPPLSGTVPTSDGAGQYNWASPSGGGGAQIAVFENTAYCALPRSTAWTAITCYTKTIDNIGITNMTIPTSGSYRISYNAFVYSGGRTVRLFAFRKAGQSALMAESQTYTFRNYDDADSSAIVELSAGDQIEFIIQLISNYSTVAFQKPGDLQITIEKL